MIKLEVIKVNNGYILTKDSGDAAMNSTGNNQTVYESKEQLLKTVNLFLESL